MFLSRLRNANTEKIGNTVVWIALGWGIIIRLWLYFQSQDLIIDEANVVRNLYDIGFLGLLRPLQYEQYAPPLFLWIEELSTLLFGYGEKATRLYPLICGVASLFLFRAIMKPLVSSKALWLPMAIMSCNYLLILYVAQVKQYMPDACIALLLIYLTSKQDIGTTKPLPFFFFWMPAGVLAIGLSMPSVFVLAGVGCYFLIRIWKLKAQNYLLPLVIAASVWVAAFGVYYVLVLKAQTNSSYLQSFHADYFLYLLPVSVEEWAHNIERLRIIVENAAGHTAINFILSIILLVAGSIVMWRKHTEKYVLVIVPVLLTILAAMLHQFSLIDRVVLFLLPLLLIVYGYGFYALLQLRWKWVRVMSIILGIVAIVSTQRYWELIKKTELYAITDGMDYLKGKGIQGEQLFVHEASVATYIYYTDIHPNRSQYISLFNAKRMKWDSDYTAETSNVKDTVYFLFTGGFPQPEKDRRIGQIEQNLRQVDYYERHVCFVFGYIPKEGTTTKY